MTKTRTDIHRPSLVDPADYGFISAFYQGSNEAMADSYSEDDREFSRWLRNHPETRTFQGNHASKATCDHCGAAFSHGVYFLHVPTDEIVAIGHICAGNTIGLPSKAVLARKRAVQAQAAANERRKVDAAREQYRAANPGVHDFLIDALENNEERFGFVLDVARKLRKYGSLSAAQTAAILKIMVKRSEQQDQRDAEPQPETPLAEGRHLIEGTVLSHKWQDGIYGLTHKMLVQLDDLNKVWGTVPTSISDVMYLLDEEGFTTATEDLKGHRVRFTATVERSRDDQHFGFFKRPTKAEVLTPVGMNIEAAKAASLAATRLAHPELAAAADAALAKETT